MHLLFLHLPAVQLCCQSSSIILYLMPCRLHPAPDTLGRLVLVLLRLPT